MAGLDRDASARNFYPEALADHEAGPEPEPVRSRSRSGAGAPPVSPHAPAGAPPSDTSMLLGASSPSSRGTTDASTIYSMHSTSRPWL